MNQLFAVLVKRGIKKFISDDLDVVSDSVFSFCCYGLMRSKLCFEPLGEDIVFQLNDV